MILLWTPLVFFGVIVALLLVTLRTMPRIKPAALDKSSAGKVAWDDVAGLDEAKEELAEVVEFLQDRRRFERLGATVPAGILLHGPPGTGKTLLAKAVATASGANFYSSSASAFVEMFAGVGAARIRKLFEEARKNAPAIVFIDELDAVGMARIRDRASPRAGSDPEPAARRARRLRRARRRDRDGRLQPPRRPRSRAAAARALRPAGLRRPAGRDRTGGDPPRPHALEAAGLRRRPHASSRAARPG